MTTTTATDLCTGVWQKKCTWRHKPCYSPLMQIHTISMWMSRWIHFRCKYAHAADLSYSFDILASCQPDTPSLTIYNERLILDFKQTGASHLHFSVTCAFGSALFGNCCLIFIGIIWNEVLLCYNSTFSLRLAPPLYMSPGSITSHLSLQKRKSRYTDRPCRKLL